MADATGNPQDWAFDAASVLDAFDRIDPRRFQDAPPFPHIVLDGLFSNTLIDALHENVLSLPPTGWDKHNDEGVEVKWRSNWKSEYDIPEPGREIVRFLNSGAFLRRLSHVTGIPNLIPDPYYTGGGFNLIKRGGYLDVHVDGNWHDEMRVHRRLNLLVYLNRNWREEWGGAFNLYDAKAEKVEASAPPIGNRTLIFETHDYSFHGHPEPLACPDDEARTSIILYYYTSAPRPQAQVSVAEPHSALWRSKDWHDKRGQKTRG